MRIHKTILDIRRSCLRQLLSLFCTYNSLRSETWFLNYSIIRKVIKHYSSFCRAMIWTSCFCRDTSHTLPLLSDFSRSFLNSVHTLCHLLVILPWAIELKMSTWLRCNICKVLRTSPTRFDSYLCMFYGNSEEERKKKTVLVIQTVMSRRAHRQEFLLPCHQNHLFIL